MNCPICKVSDTKVIDSRSNDSGGTVRRRRECISCHQRFTTYERVEKSPIRVLKKNGQRERLDPDKIRKGILTACEKRPVSTEALEEAVTQVIRKLYALEKNEVSAQAIGEEVMRQLKTLDKVAYVRYASVYKEFEDVSSFAKELKALE